MKILVLGGTGTVGSQVAKALKAKGIDVRIMTSSSEKVSQINDYEAVVGDLKNPASLNNSFTGVDGVFILNALSQDETQQGLNAVAAAKATGMKKIVYMSVYEVEQARHIPHFATKLPVENAVKESGIPYVILRPNNFYQNDTWFVDVIKNYGVYPQPIGEKGITRVDVRDIADAAANAFKTDEFDNKKIPLNGPQVLNGNETAKILSKYAGYDVNYGGHDLDAWLEQAKQAFPEWMAKDFKIMYKYFVEEGFSASPEEMELQNKVVGHPPRTYENYVSEISGMLKK